MRGSRQGPCKNWIWLVVRVNNKKPVIITITGFIGDERIEKDINPNKQYRTSINDFVSIMDQSGKYRLYKRSPFNNRKYLLINILGVSRIREYDASAKGTVNSIFNTDNLDVSWSNHIDKYYEMLEKGYEPHSVKAEILKLMEKANEKDEVLNPEAIYYKCD